MPGVTVYYQSPWFASFANSYFLQLLTNEDVFHEQVGQTEGQQQTLLHRLELSYEFLSFVQGSGWDMTGAEW